MYNLWRYIKICILFFFCIFILILIFSKPSSPSLFIVNMDRIVRRSTVQIGVQLGLKNTSHLLFADDLVFMASDEAGLQLILNALNQSVMRSICGSAHRKLKQWGSPTHSQCALEVSVSPTKEDEWVHTLGVQIQWWSQSLGENQCRADASQSRQIIVAMVLN